MEKFTLKIDVTTHGSGPAIIAALRETLAKLEKLDATNTTETLFDDLRRGHIAHDDGGNACGTFGIITQDDGLRGVRVDARDVQKEVNR